MIVSPAVAHHVRRAAEFAVHTGEPCVDLGEVVDRRDKVVDDIRSGSYRAVDKTRELDFFGAEGQFVRPRRLRLEVATGRGSRRTRAFW